MPENHVQTSNINSMEDWLRAYDQIEELYPGQILEGTIMQVAPNEILIDVGSKSEGVVSGKELERLTPEEMANLHEGDGVRVYVLRPEDEDGHPQLSIARARMEEDWIKAEQWQKEDTIFEAKVTGYNKGGLIVHVGQVRGFVPTSQVASLRRSSGDSDDEYQRRMSQLVGKSLRFKVLEIDRRRNRLILSERAAEREWRKEQKDKLLTSLEPGNTVRGEVSSLADFGAFVDLGGADGLIHLSELSWGRISHPNEVVQVGDAVEVYVLNVDRERKRIGLSLKRLQPEPWTQVTEKYHVGDEVDAVVTKLTSFGAFAKLVGEDVEGLIHISELSEGHVERPGEVVKEGDQVRAKIIRIEPERKRLGLSLRRTAGEIPPDGDYEWPEEADEA